MDLPDRAKRHDHACMAAIFCACWVLLACPRPYACAAEPATASQVEPSARIVSLLEELDADSFLARQDAAAQLEKLIADPKSASTVALQIQKTLSKADLSFEVRKQLESWLPKLPALAPMPLESDADDLAQLIRQVDDDSYALRLGAGRRLELIAHDAKRAADLLVQLRARLNAPDLSPDTAQRLFALWDIARGSWLLSDPASWKLLPVSDAEIAQALGHLVQPAPEGHQGAWLKHAVARRELLDLLARDDVAPRVKQALEAQLQKPAVDEAAAERLKDVLQWTIPALVAEIWQSRENILVQHLYVDVPQHSVGAPRPSHFSRIDDKTATCVSGSNLEPGDYPVGVAIPHSTGKDWMCQLINLPNPRRRQAFEYASKIDQQIRLAELTERTIKRLAARKESMSEVLIGSLNRLDPAALSEHIGSYLLKVDDRHLESMTGSPAGLRATHHQQVCFMLAMVGTRHVGPDLVRIIKQKRCHAASFETSIYQWPAIAALSIASRDPWADSELWLTTQITSAEPLTLIPTDAGQQPQLAIAEGDQPPAQPQLKAAGSELPQLSAGAAALLLKRYDMAHGSFGLAAVENRVLESVGCPSYRFTSPDAPQRVLDWWQRMQSARNRRQSP